MVGAVTDQDDKRRLAHAVDFILQTQNRDGGFGTYEPKRVRGSLDWFNASEIFGESTTEASYPECTASCIEALAAPRPPCRFVRQFA